jgi:hypothetical protein
LKDSGAEVWMNLTLRRSSIEKKKDNGNKNVKQEKD